MSIGKFSESWWERRANDLSPDLDDAIDYQNSDSPMNTMRRGSVYGLAGLSLVLLLTSAGCKKITDGMDAVSNKPDAADVSDTGDGDAGSGGDGGPDPDADAGDAQDGDETVDGNDGGGVEGGEFQAVCDDQHPLVQAFLDLRPSLQACLSCHVDGGLQPAVDQWFGEFDNPLKVQASFASMLTKARELVDPDNPAAGKKLNTAPFGGDHGGGDLSGALTAEDRQALDDFVNLANQYVDEDIAVQTECNEDPGLEPSLEEYLDGALRLSPKQVYIRFLRMTGTAIPEQLPNINTQQDLENAIRSATHDTGFYDWIRWNFNDITQTRFYTGKNEAHGIMQERYGINWEAFDNDEVADGPQNLFAYLVLNNMSMQQLLTANFVVIPGVKFVEGDDPNWPQRLQPVVVEAFEPYAGIWTDQLMLNKHPSTPTNINRGRAYLLMKFFYDLDVLEILSQSQGEAPQDPIPTLTAAECAMCHQGTPLDAIAASLWNWQENDYEYSDELPAELIPPVINAKAMPESFDEKRMQWMMSEIVKTPAFARSIAKMAFEWSVQRPIAQKPNMEDPDDPNFKPMMRRYFAENKYLDELAEKFAQGGYNFRELVVLMASGPFFSLSGEFEQAVPEASERYVEVGLLHPPLATPEMLDSRFRQLFGEPWTGDKGEDLFDKHDVELGGVDSRTVFERRRDPSAQSVLVMDFLGRDLGRFVVKDFAKKPNARHLFTVFPEVENLPLPMNPATEVSDPSIVLAYKSQISKILKFALGQFYTLSDPKLDEEFELFKTYWLTGLTSPGLQEKLATSHQYKNPEFGESEVIDDPHYLLRAWSAYIEDVVSRPDFLR